MFVRNIVKFTSANIFAQVVSLLSVPLITRIYEPDDYGKFSAVIAAVLIIVPVASLRLNAAFMLPRNLRDARILFIFSLASVTGFTILVFLIISLGTYFGLGAEGSSTQFIGTLTYLVPLCVLMLGLNQVLASWMLRIKDFNGAAIARGAEAVVDRAFVLSMGFMMTPMAMWLVLGRVIGPFFAVLLMLHRHNKSFVGRLFDGIDIATTKTVYRRYSDFPKISTFASLFDTSARQLPLLIMVSIFPAGIVGFYALASQVVSVPLVVIGDAVASVFFQKASEIRGNGASLSKLSEQLLANMILFLMPFFLALFFMGRPLFKFVFGEEWEEAGYFAEVLSVSLLLMFLHRPLSVLFDVLELQRQRLLFDGALATGRVTAVFIGAYIYSNVMMSLLGLVLVTVIIYSLGILYLFRQLNVEYFVVLSIIAPCIAVYIPMISGFCVPLVVEMEIVTEFVVVSVAVVLQILALYYFVRRRMLLINVWWIR